MRESQFFQEILAEGRLEGRLEGQLEMRRADILQALTIRFGTEAAAEIGDRLNAIHDVEHLSALLRTANKCRGIGGFRRALGTDRT